MVHVYALLDPTTSRPRYVGQSVNAKRRLVWHLSAAKRGRTERVYNWIRVLIQAGARPKLLVLETCPDEHADAREEHWISHYLLAGDDLTNCTQGGGGTRGWHHTDEAKRKIGVAHRGRVVSKETRRLLAEANLGKKQTPEHRAKISEAGKGRVQSAQTREKCSQAKLGNQHPLGCKRSPETRARMSAAASHGDKSPKAKATNEQAQEARRLFAEGVRQADIARRLGLDTVTVHRIVRGKTYRVG